MLEVINADTPEKLTVLSDKLFDSVVENGFKPDLIVGIATGGEVVVDSITDTRGSRAVAIKKQRQGTLKKEKSTLIKILPYLPQSFNNLLRKLEVYYREYCYKKKVWSTEASLIELNTNTINAIKKSHSILVVDDTIDSGVTMKSVIETVKLHASKTATIKSAVLNRTFSKSIVNVDYCLAGRTIIRFPWSFDVKKPKKGLKYA